jgi:hypothetical protein
MPGLDPGIHHLRKKHVPKKMDCRVKPGNDDELGGCFMKIDDG